VLLCLQTTAKLLQQLKCSYYSFLTMANVNKLGWIIKCTKRYFIMGMLTTAGFVSGIRQSWHKRYKGYSGLPLKEINPKGTQ
jgi:hypothetical protein